MNTVEAIESLCYDCTSYPCYALRHNDMCIQKRTLLEVAEKETPKKFIKGRTTAERLCPTCGKTVNWIGYPCRCGQMIDWSDVE